MIRNGYDLIHGLTSEHQQGPILNWVGGGKQFGPNGVSFGKTEAGYDIRVKQDILFKWRNPLNFQQNIMTVQVGTDSFENGRFCLASTIEEFSMPDDLVGVVHDKSTWARKGLSVFNTVIEPGWKGFLTLELVYHGNEDLIIPAGSGIAQVLFHELRNKATYNGKYQNQEDRPVPASFLAPEKDVSV